EIVGVVLTIGSNRNQFSILRTTDARNHDVEGLIGRSVIWRNQSRQNLPDLLESRTTIDISPIRGIVVMLSVPCTRDHRWGWLGWTRGSRKFLQHDVNRLATRALI